MDSIKFVPQSQKNINKLAELHNKNKGDSLIYILITLFLIYSIVVGGMYWFFVVQEQNKLSENIQSLDSINSQYYIDNDLEQGLFNISNLIENYYNPIEVIREIESAYVPGSNVSSFAYSKDGKAINISMTVPSINDVTKQIDSFNKIQNVAKSSYSEVSSDMGVDGFSFGVEIILK